MCLPRLPSTDLILNRGDLVEVPIWSLHHDPRHWPDPEAFIPDRFLPENKDKIHPFTHMPFGMGPRNCIGEDSSGRINLLIQICLVYGRPWSNVFLLVLTAMRFALMEAKVALTKLLLEAELEVAPGHEEVTLDTVNGMLRSKDGVMLILKPVKEE